MEYFGEAGTRRFKHLNVNFCWAGLVVGLVP
jgi:hypothetical protein